MKNSDYFANKVKAEQEAAAARLAQEKPVRRRNRKLSPRPQAAAPSPKSKSLRREDIGSRLTLTSLPGVL